jgi:poly [ADP-ribose] polymerase
MSHGKVDYDFIVEYAKSSRSTCKTSKKTIEKGEMRIGQMIQAANVDKKIPNWHHYKWFFTKGNKGLTKWEMLFGREKLRLEDQETIKKLIEKNSGEETSGTKRKAKDIEDSEEPEKKKPKEEETEQQRLLREENEALWKIKDRLKREVSRPKFLKEILEYNNQSSKGGDSVLIDRIAEGMLFGALPEGCGQDDCKGGHLFLDQTTGKYRCTGNSSVWSRCMWEGDPEKIEIKAWKIPDWMKDEYDYFNNWKFKRRDRVIIKNEVIRAKGKEGEEVGVKSEETIKSERAKRKFFSVGKSTKTPLEGYVIALDISKSKIEKISEMIAELGGTYSEKVNPKVTHLISTDDNYDDETPKVAKAITLDIPVLSERWITDSKKKQVFLNQKDYLIGGSNFATDVQDRYFTYPADDEKPEAD